MQRTKGEVLINFHVLSQLFALHCGIGGSAVVVLLLLFPISCRIVATIWGSTAVKRVISSCQRVATIRPLLYWHLWSRRWAVFSSLELNSTWQAEHLNSLTTKCHPPGWLVEPASCSEGTSLHLVREKVPAASWDPAHSAVPL